MALSNRLIARNLTVQYGEAKTRSRRFLSRIVRLGSAVQQGC